MKWSAQMTTKDNQQIKQLKTEKMIRTNKPIRYDAKMGFEAPLFITYGSGFAFLDNVVTISVQVAINAEHFKGDPNQISPIHLDGLTLCPLGSGFSVSVDHQCFSRWAKVKKGVVLDRDYFKYVCEQIIREYIITHSDEWYGITINDLE